MTSIVRSLLPPIGGALLLAAFAAGSGLAPGAFVHGPSLALVLIGPWVTLALTDSFGAARSTMAGLLAPEPDASPGRILLLESRIRTLTSFALAFGVLAAMGAFIGGMNRLASLQGQVQPGHAALLYSEYLLGPLYALLLEALLHGPARSRLAAERARGRGEPGGKA